MFNQNGEFTLELGTSKRIFSTNILESKHHPVYLTKFPFDNDHPLIDNFSIIAFLSIFTKMNVYSKKNEYSFSQTKNQKPRIIDGELFVNYLEISILNQKLFKVMYQKAGNYFVIQILSKHENIKYSTKNIILNTNSRKVFILANEPILSQDSVSPIQYQTNQGIHEISDFYNNKSVDKKHQNQITASLFYSIAPFLDKTIERTRIIKINPDKTIDGVLNSMGGKYFRFHSNEDINSSEFPFQIFCWFSPFFDSIVKSEYFHLIKTVELDATFSALEPYVISIPLLIYRNTGIPIGLLASVSESTSLYSLFFEALKKLDSENPEEKFSYFKIFQEKKFLTDEHKSFLKLQKKYGIEIHNCFVHLIRSVGANSLLGYLLSEILYQYSYNEWQNNYERLYQEFKYLYEIKDEKSDKIRFEKVSKIFGRDPSGNSIEINPNYSQIFNRIIDNIPTTTNHIESLHCQINQITSGARSLSLKLAYICKYINDRTLRSNSSSENNLKSYLNLLNQKALNKISMNSIEKNKYSNEKCECGKNVYYSHLFGIKVPCIHQILNEKIDKNIIYESLRVYDIDFLNDYNYLEIYDINTELKFKKKPNKGNDESNKDNKPISIELEEIDDESIESIIIKRTYSKFENVIKDKKIDFAVLSLSIYKEMKNDEELNALEKDNESKFWAIYQVRLWLSLKKYTKDIYI